MKKREKACIDKAVMEMEAKKRSSHARIIKDSTFDPRENDRFNIRAAISVGTNL